eukprot:TRINITY_DN2736_c2_g3_i1.p2 TRINITY_DN2736_c2_g3~~TRINITY_DN2736_c2_g3_i1.p2  ORF type:complete len:174 (+),score=30.70 TRINITY_DN2736_c2_g3_i1:688-1209(+)
MTLGFLFVIRNILSLLRKIGNEYKGRRFKRKIYILGAAILLRLDVHLVYAFLRFYEPPPGSLFNQYPNWFLNALPDYILMITIICLFHPFHPNNHVDDSNSSSADPHNHHHRRRRRRQYDDATATTTTAMPSREPSMEMTIQVSDADPEAVATNVAVQTLPLPSPLPGQVVIM